MLVVVRIRPIADQFAGIDDAGMLTYYGCTPQDWEEVSDDRHFVEFIDGRLIVHSPAGLEHQRMVGFVHHLLRSYVEARDIGEVLTGPFAMELSLERKFEPDVMFLANKTRANLAADRLLGPADLAIEIASRSTRGYDRGEKRECYRVGGVREYWMIDGFAQTLTVDRPAGQQVLQVGDGVVRSETCLGFWIRAEWLWASPPVKVADCLAEIRSGSEQQ